MTTRAIVVARCKGHNMLTLPNKYAKDCNLSSDSCDNHGAKKSWFGLKELSSTQESNSSPEKVKVLCLRINPPALHHWYYFTELNYEINILHKIN